MSAKRTVLSPSPRSAQPPRPRPPTDNRRVHNAIVRIPHRPVANKVHGFGAILRRHAHERAPSMDSQSVILVPCQQAFAADYPSLWLWVTHALSCPSFCTIVQNRRLLATKARLVIAPSPGRRPSGSATKVKRARRAGLSVGLGAGD